MTINKYCQKFRLPALGTRANTLPSSSLVSGCLLTQPPNTAQRSVSRKAARKAARKAFDTKSQSVHRVPYLYCSLRARRHGSPFGTISASLPKVLLRPLPRPEATCQVAWQCHKSILHPQVDTRLKTANRRWLRQRKLLQGVCPTDWW